MNTVSLTVSFYVNAEHCFSNLPVNVPRKMKQAVQEAATICHPCKLTLEIVSESRVTWAICVPILVFLALTLPDLGPMYAARDRQTSHSRQTRIIA